MSRKLIIEIIAALFILLFFYTAINKIIAIDTLKQVIPTYPLIGHMPNLVAWGLPIVELVVVVLLFIPKTRMKGIIASLALMLAFTIYLVYMLSFTTKLPCTCGGMLQKLSWPQHLVFNIVFILLAITALILERRNSRNVIGRSQRFQQAHG